MIVVLGPTATVLAYDLAKAGYQALDIGHLGKAYDWLKRKETIVIGKFLLLRDRLHTFDTNAVKTYDLLCHRAKRSFNRVNKRQEVLILRFS